MRHEFACPCCGANPVDSLLVLALQNLRTKLQKPIRITSGYRCPKHNRSINGNKHSYHLYAMAADIVIPGLTSQQMYNEARGIISFRNGGIGIYPDDGFIHVDVRKKAARWARINGRYVSYYDYERTLP